MDSLTPRERQMLALVCNGLTSKEIAYDLGVAVSTVNVLVARGMARLGFHSRRALLEAFTLAGAIRSADPAPAT